MTGLVVDPTSFQAAASALWEDASTPVTNAFTVLVGALDGCESMAGSDPVGSSWASAYEQAAGQLRVGWQNTATSVYRVCGLLEQCGNNHAAAEAASHPGATGGSAVQTRFNPEFSVHLDPIPSAGGGSGGGSVGPPSGWSVIEHAVGYVWPGGHQDQLHTAAAAWDTAAAALDGAADAAPTAAVKLFGVDSPEVFDAMRTLNGLEEPLHELAGGARALASSARALAHHIDTVHSQVEHQLADLVAQSVVIEGAGALFSVLTAGGSELVAQGVESWRLERIVTAVRGIFATFTGLVADLLETLPSIGEVGSRVAAATRELAGLRIRVVEVTGAPGLRVLALGRDERLTSTAMTAEERAEAGLVDAAERSPLPELKLSWKQAEKKFKHATALGVNEAKGQVGYQRFIERVHEFVDASGTTRIAGKYRNDEAIINYNRSTHEMVLQHPDGTFWSTWRLTDYQLDDIERTGSFGFH